MNVQGDADFRKQVDDLSGLRVRSDRGGMVPLGTLAQIRDVSGPVMIIRYNLYPAATVLLARYVLAERLRPAQKAGMATALVAAVMLALG